MGSKHVTPQLGRKILVLFQISPLYLILDGDGMLLNSKI